MSLKDKLERKKQELKDRMQRGREVTEQMKAERMRKKQDKTKYLQPGTFRYGLHHRQSITGFMEDVKERRRQKREEKEDD